MDSNEVRKMIMPEYVLTNSLLPTNIVSAVAHRHGLSERTISKGGDGFLYSIRDFQRVAMTQDFETACMMFNLLLDDDKQLEPEDIPTMQKMYDLTKKEANGLIVGTVLEIMHGNASNRDKMDAAKLLSILVNDEQSLDGTDIRKLMAKVFK